MEGANATPTVTQKQRKGTLEIDSPQARFMPTGNQGLVISFQSRVCILSCMLYSLRTSCPLTFVIELIIKEIYVFLQNNYESKPRTHGRVANAILK